MKKAKIYFFALLSVLSLNVATLHAGSIEGSGFIDSRHGFSYSDKNQRLTSKTRLRYQGWVPQNSKTSGTFSFNATYDDLNFDRKNIELRELFIDHNINNLDFRIGRQFIMWGKMDGLSITDLVSPRNYSEFLSGEYDDTRLPVDAIKATYSKNGQEWQFLLIPSYKETRFAPQGNPWAIKNQFFNTSNIKQQRFKKPANTIENSEIALKYSMFGNGLDYSLSLFRTWDDMPVYRRKASGNKINLFPETYKLTVAGAELAKAKDEFVYRLETALHMGKRHMTEIISAKDFYKNNDFNIGAGIDWLPGNNVEITGQFIYKKILSYNKEISEKKDNCLATLRIAKKYLRETLKLSTMNYVDISNNSGFSRFSSDYAINDGTHILLGSDWFYGSRGTFGQFNRNDNLWLEIKYSF